MIHLPGSGIRIMDGVDFARRGGAEAQYYQTFNATSTVINCGNDSSLTDLADEQFTVEAWIKADGYGEGGTGRAVDISTGGRGWLWYIQSGNGLVIDIKCVTTSGASKTTPTYFSNDSTWRHVAFTWDDASFTNPKLWIDGTERTTQVSARNGAVVSDSGDSLRIGNNSVDGRTWDGDIAWVRISDNIRYTTGFTPPAKDAPPASDANTIEQWNLNDGSGVTAEAEENTPTNDGTITDGSWTAF